MKFTIIDCDQQSDMWTAARLGRLTGSKAAAMQTKIKSGEAAGRRNLRVDLALERVTGRPQERDFTTPDLENGNLREPLARDAYEVRTGNIVDRTGFLSCGPIMAGCSLDGHVNDFEGIVEIKSPKEATHLEYLQTKQIPTAYRWQCLHSLWVTGAQWCDFVSYQPSFPEHLQYLCVRMARSETEVAAYEKDAMQFLAEVALEVKTIKELVA